MQDHENIVGPGEPDDGAAVPASLARAVAFIDTHPAASLSTASIASVAGVSSHMLENQFRTHFGVSPLQYLRQLRLEGVRTELHASDTATPLTEIARRWGFAHFGRFTDTYTTHFGQHPEAAARAHDSLNDASRQGPHRSRR
ncbi:helix-turn-helix transcriptional regulator [Curtobacterium sp. VKM Ac-1393]|uniref:helix-turn-helix transcriptional regulator n=1 Tax=Curtobacterium sp. VKM Ac-1393 TaxID=2783814 RepID=UPI00188C91EE|nr:helix-turn-helix transcriptional regulator [Curtobacterium sp. VKM Ac-1393]MBF4609583.1 AraC family transcriptional regulator [Curtobacterium sp. VKM Ac-1393]